MLAACPGSADVPQAAASVDATPDASDAPGLADSAEVAQDIQADSGEDVLHPPEVTEDAGLDSSTDTDDTVPMPDEGAEDADDAEDVEPLEDVPDPPEDGIEDAADEDGAADAPEPGDEGSDIEPSSDGALVEDAGDPPPEDVLEATDAGDETALPPDTSASVPGDTCEAAILVLSLPFSASGGFDDLADDLSGACGSAGAGESDVVLRLDAAAGAYAVTLQGADDAALYVLGEACGALGACVAQQAGPGTAGLVIPEPTVLYIVVEAGSGSTWSVDVQGFVPAATCEDYCAVVTGACPSAWPSGGGCAKGCAALQSAGGPDALACRISAALKATSDPAQCVVAGPSGGGACGTWCEAYCALDAALCASTAGTDCPATCAGLSDLGAPGVGAGDSVQCRLVHLALASHGTGADAYCAAAAPDGGGVCIGTGPTGDTCEDAIPIEALPFSVSADTTWLTDAWAGAPGCTVAAGVPDQVFLLTPPSSGLYEVTLAPAGDGPAPASVSLTSACGACLAQSADLVGGGTAVFPLEEGEDYHLVVDGLFPSDVGPYTLTVSGPIAPTCGAYCDDVQSTCVGALSQFASVAACADWCLAQLPGDPGGTTGNTVACRMHHTALAALEGPAAHCSKAGPTGGGTCGGWCEVYCSLAETACADLFDGEASCQSACATLPIAGPPGAFTGDTVQCRVQHLLLADCEDASPASEACQGPPAMLGDSCLDAIAIASVPFSAAGDTAGLADDYAAGPVCAVDVGFASGDGDGVPDQVYAFTPAVSGSYRVTLAPGGSPSNPSFVVLTEACGVCLDASGDLFEGGDVAFALTAGTPYHLVVDGLLPGDEGQYVIDVTLEEAP